MKGLFILKINQLIICPKCRVSHFTVKRETTYLYSYKLEMDIPEKNIENDSNLPYLFDNREQIYNIEYLQCDECGAMYTYDLEKDSPHVQLTILQKAIRCDYVNSPEFLG